LQILLVAKAWILTSIANHKYEDVMKRFIISAFIVGVLSYSLTPVLAAPSDHDLKTTKGVTELHDEIQKKSGGQ
jgi:hypothetical protein